MDAIGILSGVPALTVTAVTLALGTIMFIIAVGLIRQRLRQETAKIQTGDGLRLVKNVTYQPTSNPRWKDTL